MGKLGIIYQINVSGASKYQPKKYDTSKDIGIKWQIDVKYVPKVCKSVDIPKDKVFYQYTCIDEVTREEYLFLYYSYIRYNYYSYIIKHDFM